MWKKNFNYFCHIATIIIYGSDRLILNIFMICWRLIGELKHKLNLLDDSYKTIGIDREVVTRQPSLIQTNFKMYQIVCNFYKCTMYTIANDIFFSCVFFAFCSDLLFYSATENNNGSFVLIV